MSQPDGELIAKGVGIAIPSSFKPEYVLWVAAMQRAAQMQYNEGPKPAGRFALAVTVVGLVVVGAIALIGRQPT